MSVIEGVTPEGILRYSFSQVSCGGAAIFLDRDGVINEQITGTYVTTWSEFRFLPGIAEALAEISRLDVPMIVVSNQAGVGKAMIDVAELASITRRFVGQLTDRGARIDAVYYCPHTPDDRCGCRKPMPGLLQRASADWGLDLARCVFVGDSATDAQAAEAAGCRMLRLESASDIPGIPAMVREALS